MSDLQACILKDFFNSPPPGLKEQEHLAWLDESYTKGWSMQGKQISTRVGQLERLM